MLKKDKLTDLLISLLLFVPTIVNVNNTLYVVFLAMGLYLFIKESNAIKSQAVFLLILSTFITSIVFYVTFAVNNKYQDEVNGLSSFLPVPLSILACFFISKSKYINKNVFRFVALYISAEVFVGVVEYALGVSHFITPTGTNIDSTFGDGGLLYYSRVFGLSSNSSVLALKCVSLILISYWAFDRKYTKVIFSIIGICGLYITLNRSGIFAVILFYLLMYFRSFKVKYLFVSLVSVAVIATLIYLNFDSIFNQLNRGKDTLDISGRDEIIKRYFDFFLENPLLGNNYHVLRLLVLGRPYHSHNSFMHILAETGFLYFMILIWVIIKLINKHNYLFILPIMLYSMTQYGIFWGVSFLDIIFFYFLTQVNESNFPSDNKILIKSSANLKT